MSPFLTAILFSWVQTVSMLLIFGLILGALSYFTPCNRGQKKPTVAQLYTDLGYWFLVPFATRYVRVAFFIFIATWMLGITTQSAFEDFMKHGHGHTGLNTLPLGVQIVLIFLLQDIYMYWVHRWFHTAKVWKIHAVHHSSKSLEWFSTARFHPINLWLEFTLADALILAIGFSPEALFMMMPFNAFYSAFVHANLNWTFGPFKKWLASPVFHRWHHTMLKEGQDKNFAPTFPILDVIFGTYYMPEGRLPEQYGVEDETLTDNFFAQLIYPFRRKKS